MREDAVHLRPAEAAVDELGQRFVVRMAHVISSKVVV
jgi:hypothetical protein